MLKESLREDGARLQLLLKQAHDHIGQCLDIVAKLTPADS